jgi:hypothetical protein
LDDVDPRQGAIADLPFDIQEEPDDLRLMGQPIAGRVRKPG